MKITKVLILIIALFALSFNTQAQEKENLYKKVLKLEKKVTELQNDLTNQKIKTKLAISLLGSKMRSFGGDFIPLSKKVNPFIDPWIDFFNDDNFWDRVVDVGYSTCSSGCSQRYSSAFKACKDSEDANNCKERARKANTECQISCVTRFDPFPDDYKF